MGLVLSVPIFDADVFWAFANNSSVTKAAEERSVRGDGDLWGDSELSGDCKQAHRPQVFLIPSALKQLTVWG